MSQTRTKKSPGYSAVVLSGGSYAIAQASEALRSAGFLLSEASKHSVVVQDVREHQVDTILALVADQALTVSAYGAQDYVDTERVQMRKAFRLSLQPKKWYHADNMSEQYPLVFIRDVKIQRVGETGEEVQLVTMELHPRDGSSPVKHTAPSDDVAAYGLRPASQDDFEALGFIVPDAMFLSASVVEDSTPQDELLENVSL